MSAEPCLCGTEFTCLADDHGCYICQPDNPTAAEEGCAKCDRDYWGHVLSGGVA